MRKIINDKAYDTSTAKAVGTWSYGSYRDFHYVAEILYKKKTGEFFLYGEGGPASKYAKKIDTNCWTGSEKIVPLTEDEAKKWAEENLDGMEYENIFGEVEE